MVEPIEHEKYSFSGSSDKPPYENPVNKTYLNKMLIGITITTSTWIKKECVSRVTIPDVFFLKK